MGFQNPVMLAQAGYLNTRLALYDRRIKAVRRQMGSTSKPNNGVYILAAVICALVVVPLLSTGALGDSTYQRTAKITEIALPIFIPAFIAIPPKIEDRQMATAVEDFNRFVLSCRCRK